MRFELVLTESASFYKYYQEKEGLVELNEIFDLMIEEDASDAFIKGASPIQLRVYTEIKPAKRPAPSCKDTAELVSKIINGRGKDELQTKRNCEFAQCYKDRWRFRIVIFYEKDNYAIILRKVNLKALSFSDLNLPVALLQGLCRERRGLVLITGITGSGKSTAIASMLDYINENFDKHILTIEEPIEFTFKEKKAIINQREIGRDVFSYADALRQSVVHSPDIVYVTNIRDRDTCYAALTAAETGMLVFSTVHSVNAVSTIERMVNFFPTQEHRFVLTQLSVLLKGIVSLRLIPRIDTKGLIPAYEAMTLSPTISALISENNLWEIPKYIAESSIFNMKSFNQCLMELIKQKKISKEAAMDYSDEKKELSLMMNS